MSTFPGHLPAGYLAQPAWLHEWENRVYEMNRVYDADGKLDAGMSFWLVTPLDQGDRPVLRMVSYDAVRSQQRITFAEFSSDFVPAQVIDGWIANEPVDRLEYPPWHPARPTPSPST